MSLDFCLTALRRTTVHHGNITHNLVEMAKEAGIYEYLWNSQEKGIWIAASLIEPLEKGIALLEKKPEFFKTFNPSNGWGNYEGLLKFSKELLNACINNPDADIYISK